MRAAVGLGLAALAVGTGVPFGTSATKASTLVIWADAGRLAPVTQAASAWAAPKGVTVQVVEKELDLIRQEVGTVPVEVAPDVIAGSNAWIGELAASGAIVPVSPSAATRRQFPAYALSAFSHGTAIKRLYGAPVAVENVALFTNTKLAKVPSSFPDLERRALAVRKKTKAAVGLAVQQGPDGDAYHLYPFFSGLGGYIFGTNKAGNLDPSDIGVANAYFLRNARLIDKWNKEALLRSQVASDTARDLFTNGKVAYYVTGPWFLDDIKVAGIKYAISGFPQIVAGVKSVPLVALRGFMVTKHAVSHGVGSLAQDFVANYLMRPAAQLALASDRFPANVKAAARVTDTDLKAFGKASTGGVPMPNIPQAANVWQDLGAAWARSTKGAGAVPARRAFIAARRSIARKIG